MSTMRARFVRTGVRTIICLGAAALVAAGCQETLPQCTTDTDCETGQVCDESGTCVPGPQPECAADADCDDGLFCNGAETCTDGACQPGIAPCTAGLVCDEEGDACAAEELAFATNAFFDDFDRVHGLHRAAVPACTTCHHDQPVSAGFAKCSECHSLAAADLNSYKEMAHDENESGDGCRACHAQEQNDDGTWKCSFCHTGLSAL